MSRRGRRVVIRRDVNHWFNTFSWWMKVEAMSWWWRYFIFVQWSTGVINLLIFVDIIQPLSVDTLEIIPPT